MSSGVLDDPALVSELADLRASGTAIGLTVSGGDQLETIHRALETGAFDAVQGRPAPHWSRPTRAVWA